MGSSSGNGSKPCVQNSMVEVLQSLCYADLAKRLAVVRGSEAGTQ